MDVRSVLKQINEAIEHDQVEGAVLHCIRLARGIRDLLSAATFLRETGLDGKEIVRAMYEELKDFQKDAIDFIMKRSLEHWIERRTLSFSLGRDQDGDEQRVVTTPVGSIDFELRQWAEAISQLVVPAGMSPYDTAAFTDSYANRRARSQLQRTALQEVRQRVKINCLNYAINVERQLDLQNQTESFVQNAQTEVNNYFRTRSPDVFAKLTKAAELLARPDPENLSLVLTQVRRAIKAAADHFYPPRTGLVLCSDGKERDLSDDRYINRLTEYVSTTFPRSAAADLLKAELDYLMVFAKRLNDLSSKGVHADVEIAEARQGLLGLYLFLNNVISKQQQKPKIPSQ